MKVMVMVCTKKILFMTDGPFWLQKWSILRTGLALRIFLKFYRMKEANRYMNILLVVFREKKSFGAL